MVTSEKKQSILNSYNVIIVELVKKQEEEKILEREIHSYEQTISTYTAKVNMHGQNKNQYNTLKEEESTIQQELESVEGVVTHYKALQEQNARLIEEIETRKNAVAKIREARRRTIDNLLSEEEYERKRRVMHRAKELEAQRKALDASEREEAALMVEVRMKKRDNGLGGAFTEGDGW